MAAWMIPLGATLLGTAMQHDAAQRKSDAQVQAQRQHAQQAIQQQNQQRQEYDQDRERMLADAFDASNLGRDATEEAMKERAKEVGEWIRRDRKGGSGGGPAETSATGDDSAGERAFTQTLEPEREDLAAKRRQRSDAKTQLGLLGDVLSQGQRDRAPLEQRMSIEDRAQSNREARMPMQFDAARERGRAAAAGTARDQQFIGSLLQGGGRGALMSGWGM